MVGEAGEEWCGEPQFADFEARYAAQDELDLHIGAWTATQEKFEVEQRLRDAGVPVAAVMKPEERIDIDSSGSDFGLWPTVQHAKMGRVRVDGQPVRFSRTDWRLERGGPCLGEHNAEVLTRLLGYSADEVAALRDEGVI